MYGFKTVPTYVNTLRLALLASCLVVAIRTTAQTVELKVALFPYLPSASNGSNAQLTARLEKDFEARNPDVDLILRPLAPVNDDLYDPLWIAGQLKGGVERGFTRARILRPNPPADI
jgi:hypothetical protein